MNVRGRAAALGVALGAARMAAADVVFPADPSVVNAKTELGARGDGVADDTDALQAGLDASCRGKTSKVLFLPNGTYRVTRTLVVPHGVGPWVYGASRDGVVIRLDDHIASTSVTAVLRTHRNDAQATSADFFMRNFRNLTVDVGDNPGIDGIRWFGNNSSILQNIRVTGRGKVGINSGFVGQNGPNLIQDVVVEGFETGILSQWIWGQTISRATIRNCRSNAVSVCANSVAIEQLTVENTPCALFNTYPNDWTWWGGVVALVGGTFSHPGGAPAAIVNRSVLYVRDLSCTGYTQVIRSETPGGSVARGPVSEYLSHEPAKAFPDAPNGSFRLPIEREPAVPWETDLAKWVCANDHGAISGDNKDDTAAIQRAVDAAAAAGASTVYFRGIGGGDPNWYTLAGAVRIHGSVRHILGLGFGRIVAGPEGRFVVGDEAAPVVKFQHVQAFGGRGATYENRSASNTLVVESCDGFILGSGRGDIFITDCPASVELRSPGQRAWARQLNPEGSGDLALVRNHGGKLWILGVKHEGAGPRFLNDNGGQTEIFGLFNYGPGLRPDDPRPMLETDNSAFCLMGAREIAFGGSTFPIKAREVRGDETRDLAGGGWIGWALYSGWASNQLAGPRAAARPALRPDGEAFLDAVSIAATSTTAGAALRYTLDGSAPSARSPVLPSPLVLTSSATLKVRAFAPGLPPSATRAAVYTRLIPREPDAAPPGAAGLAWAYYELPAGAKNLPDFAGLTPAATGTASTIDLQVRRRDLDFALRFQGWFAAPANGLYTFHTVSDDGSRLWVGDTLVVDNDGQHGDREASGRLALKAGPHPFAVGYYQGDGGSSLRVEVEGPALKRQPLAAPVPAAMTKK